MNTQGVRRAQFGAGGTNIPGFSSYDIEVDITKPLPFQDGQLEMVVASHVLEHTSSGQALGFLQECHRILRVDGMARITCPIIGQWLPKDLAVSLVKDHGHQIILNEQLMRDLFWIAGFDPQKVHRVDFNEFYDNHHTQIGREQDHLESCRMEAYK